MILKRTSTFTCLSLLTAAVIGLATFSFSTAEATSVGGLKPADAAATKSLKPGLAVSYIGAFVREVDQCEEYGGWKPGPPLKALDWNVGEGTVLTATAENGVCAKITGFMNFPKAGDYILTIQSNDGVRLLLSDELIIEDPDVHPDRFSEYVTVKITKAGWYPLHMLYFERKNTSTLELYWQPPGAKDFVLVPGSAFGH